MKNCKEVDSLISAWKASGLSPAELCVRAAEACLGWPYVWGGYGQVCTPANRRSYANRSSCPAGEAEQIRKKCPVLNGSSAGCGGCKYYPGEKVRFFDCRGFTRWILQQAGISLQGAGATSQWNTAGNWVRKGSIADLPRDTVCCVFMQNRKDHKTMEHTGLHIGGGVIIHCSGEVKRGKATDRGWTHFAVPAGLEGKVVSMPGTVWNPTIRRGSSGAAVRECQEALLRLGFDLGSYGADGKFGAKTQEAVKEFQHCCGLVADGIAGPMTWDALEKALALLDKNADSAVFYYTVTVPRLTQAQAEELLRTYPGAVKTEEKE